MVKAAVRSCTIGARPNSDARLSATAVQPALTSAACSPAASTSRSSKLLASLMAYPWSGPGYPRRGPSG